MTPIFFFLTPQIPQIIKSTDLIEALKAVQQTPKEINYMIFLLSGGVAFFILKEVFKYLKSRDEKAKGTPPIERRASCIAHPNMILMADKVGRNEVGIQKILDIQVKQTEIMAGTEKSIELLQISNTQIAACLNRFLSLPKT